jgi:hypothetical protein
MIRGVREPRFDCIRYIPECVKMLSDIFSLDTRKENTIYSSVILKHVKVNVILSRPNGIKPINVNAIYSRRNAIFDLLLLSYNLKVKGNQFHGDNVPEKIVVAQIIKSKVQVHTYIADSRPEPNGSVLFL